VSWVLGESGQKSIRIEICKKNLTQPNPICIETWQVRLARRFQSILTALQERNADKKIIFK